MCIFRKFKVSLLMVVISLAISFGKSALADDIILNDLGGQPVGISSYQGKPVILFFWTTWCPYCRKELKKLNQQGSQLTKEGIVILGINVSESEYRVKRFFEGYQLNFKILLDKSGILADQYNLLGVPTFILLNKAGQVISRGNSLPDNYKSLLFG
jgi:peroxiredoxin